MVIMFRRNQTALLSVQLLALCQVFAGIVRDELKNMQVFRGDSVQFTCNTSGANIRQIDWTKVSRTKGRLVFSHSISTNQTFSNWTSHRLIIDRNLPPKLNILNAEHDDAGLYTCTVTAAAGPETFQWNLTVSEKPEEISPSWILQYILAPVIGLLLCAIAPAVCLCSFFSAGGPGRRTRTQSRTSAISSWKQRWSSLNRRLAQTERQKTSMGDSTWRGSIPSMVYELTRHSDES
ncbi:uncharacterized protein LOC121616394 isoform X1 [Chelmon rostratus]|uniref:uncharacterized protein LOC121616394 isoform X1 n=1 Tax=Chelmon rostratus TaxID=109905 RepID=UPI001BE73DA1|nr:uncharacterized protein LOC121616394 isoform X1 [Chelmon rostratus]